MRRLQTSIALLLAASTCLAEPPELDVRNVEVKLVEGKLAGRFTYRMIVGTFYEWNTDPTAVPGLMKEVTSRTGVRVNVDYTSIGLDEQRIDRNPLLIMTGNRFFNLTEAETKNLRRYLQAGGFIYADDCGGADHSFRKMISTLLPDAKLAKLDKDHPIYRAFYKLDGTPKILDLYQGEAVGYGAFIGDRLAVFYTYDTDVPCGWEKHPDGSFVHLLTPAKHEQSYRLGVNVVMYALRQLHKRGRQPDAPKASTASAPAEVRTHEVQLGSLRRYRMEVKMPCNLIRAIAPAGRYVWFAGRRMLPGEQEGLARYDYQTDRWEVFLDSEGVLADEINCLAPSDDGVWIGTSTIRRRWNFGLWFYDPAAGKSRKYTREDGLVDFDVYDLLLRGKRLYAATRSGLAIHDTRTAAWSKDPTHHRMYTDLAMSLAADDRYVWIGRASGLRRYDTRQDRFDHFDAANSPIEGMVDVVVADGPQVWVSAPPRLLLWRGGRFTSPEECQAIARADIRDGAADAKLVCLATRRRGLHVLNKAGKKWAVFDSDSGLPTDDIALVALDDRSIWVALGDDPLGVGRYDRKKHSWSFHTHRAGIPCDHIYALASAGEILYVGTMANGLWAYRPEPDRWVNLNLPHRSEHALTCVADVYALLPAGKTVWFGSNRGLCRHATGSTTYEEIEGMTAAVAALAEADGRIICGTKQKGLLAYDPAKKTWIDLNEAFDLTLRAITALATDDRHVYAGTEQGLVILDRAAGKAIQAPAPLDDAAVTALRLEGPWLWVATTDRLLRFRPAEGRVESISALSDAAGALLADGGSASVLVGTPSGLACWRTEGQLVWDSRLRGHVVSALAADAKHVWIGTLGHGLIRADRGGPTSRPP